MIFSIFVGSYYSSIRHYISYANLGSLFTTQQPQCVQKAQQELDTHVGRERLVNESDVKNLVYLQAIIKETFRMYPALPLALPHETMEDSTVSGYNIPAGTRLLMNLSKIHRYPDMWSDPDEFQPERFLATGNKDCDVRGQDKILS